MDASSEDYLKRDKRQLAMKKTYTPILKIYTKTLWFTPTNDIFTTVYRQKVHSIAVSSGLKGLPALVYTSSVW